ncbi:MAG: hypothetical protein CMI18_09725 [Opitutaceae bacterium]|nr:hypothetical protein [Opitutaceae bacterium]
MIPAEPFYTLKNENLNGAELELLWRRFVSDFLSSDLSICLSEKESVSKLESFSKLEIQENREDRILDSSTWYLYREDEVVLGLLRQEQA